MPVGPSSCVETRGPIVMPHSDGDHVGLRRGHQAEVRNASDRDIKVKLLSNKIMVSGEIQTTKNHKIQNNGA